MRPLPSPSVLAIGPMLVVPLLALGPADSGVVAVLASPGGGLAGSIGVVAAADGEIVGAPGGRVLLARSDRPGFAGRLYAAGAWLVLPSFGPGCAGRAQDPGPRVLAQITTTQAPSAAMPSSQTRSTPSTDRP